MTGGGSSRPGPEPGPPAGIEALVIGAGPAGLMAAEALASAGRRVLVAEAKPSIGRKFLMAGKSGLNLTKAEPPEAFAAAYSAGRDRLAPLLAEFGPEAAMAWARGLGVEVFAGSSGRVFPVGMKASPLLRAWAARLAAGGVETRTRWRWTGWEGTAAVFDTPEGAARVTAGATVLALGGGSWARLGSDGAWVPVLAAEGAGVEPFAPSNVGWRVDWSPGMARHFGAPVKPVRLTAGGRSLAAEFVVSARGIEGGGVYALGPELRDGAALTLDLAPGLDLPAVAARLARPRGKASLSNHLRKTLGLSPVKIALLRDCAGPALADPQALAAAVKALTLPLLGPRPLDEAISTAGGLTLDAVDAGLMLRARPGVFAAGEMLAWDAPTGGYLLTACLATGLRAGRSAADWLAR
jgi:uncharacterized flavoprotein (TIGR03862 family)